MTAPAPKFRSVAATPLDVSDEALNELSDDFGIPALVKPEPKSSEPPAPPLPTATQNLPQDAIAAVAAPIPAAKTKKRATSQKMVPSVDLAVEETKRISLDVPGYIAEQIRRRVFDERASACYYFLSGLKAIGFDVRDNDLVPDARRKEFRN